MSGQQDITGCDASRTENQDNVVENENKDLSLDKVITDENSPVLTQEIETTDTDNQNQEETNFYGMREHGDIRLVLLGRTGSGKSATGNTILAKKEFLSKASGSSITEQCQLAQNRSDGHRLLVVDTPGLFDTNLSQVENEDCIRMVLLGKTGSGKSATGNTILGNTQFETRLSSSSVTNCCAVRKGKLGERQLVIVDTPGVFHTNNTTDKPMNEIVRCITMSSPGPHAFLLVIKADRFTEEESKATNSLLELFGDHILAFTVVIFTRLDDIEEEGISIDTFVKGSTEALNCLIKRVNLRYIAFNNRGTKTQKLTNISSLTTLINKMQLENGGQYYTTDMLRKADTKRQAKLQNVERTNKLEKLRIVENAKIKFKNVINSAELTKCRLQDELSKQKEQSTRMKTECEESRQVILGMLLDLTRTKACHQNDLFNTIKEEQQKVEDRLNDRSKQENKSISLYTASSCFNNDEIQLQNFEHETIIHLRNQKIHFQRQMKGAMNMVTQTLDEGISEIKSKL